MDRVPVRRAVAITAAIVVLAFTAAVACGCSASPMQKAQSAGGPTAAGKRMMSASADTSPGIPACYECSGKGKPPVVGGGAAIENGAQVVSIKIENGYYSPNRISVKAGMPVKVVFTGKTKDCAGKPKFASLKKQIDIRSSGSGTIDLGALAAGTYQFTCGMGADAGMIVAR
jgi:plastocyanin